MVYSGSQTEFPFLDKQELMVRDRPWNAQLGANLNFINHIGNYSHSVSNSKGERFYIKFSVSPESSLIIRWFSSVQSLSHVRIFVTPWTAVPQASLSVTSYQSLLRLMSIESVMPSNHLILCKESVYNAGDPGSIPESGRFPGEGNGYPLQ